MNVLVGYKMTLIVIRDLKCSQNYQIAEFIFSKTQYNTIAVYQIIELLQTNLLPRRTLLPKGTR